MLIIFYILAALQVYLSYRSLRSGLEYLRFFKREITQPPSGFTPFATVIAPCKGREVGLRENLAPLLQQNYPDYEIIFVVDDANDPSVEIIKEIELGSAIVSRLIVAPKAANSGQKVENLREAVLHSKPESQALVFVDSDVRPDENWLASILSPLEDESIGAATGYRWFVPERFSLAAEFRSVWNASIASALGANMKTNFCWGGSMAIRRETFDRLKVRERWAGALSDDFALTAILNNAGLSIRFVPQAILPSFGNCSLANLLEFTNRQMKITRVYSPKLWLHSFLGSGLYAVIMVLAVLILFASTPLSANWITALVILSAIFALGTAKSALRLSAIITVLNGRGSEVWPRFIPHLCLWVLTPLLFLLNCFVALVSRRVCWRGITYEMVSPTETRVLERQ